jgi:hypothetical protein
MKFWKNRTDRTKIFLEENFLEKRDSQMRRHGRKSTAGNSSIKGIPRGTTTFLSVLEMRRAATPRLLAMRLRFGTTRSHCSNCWLDSWSKPLLR